MTNSRAPATITNIASDGHFSTNTFRTLDILSKARPKGKFSYEPLYKVRGGLPERVLPLHHHRHRTHMSFTVVLGMDVLQHFASGQRSSISEGPVKVLDALRVSTGKTEEDRAIVVSTNAVHNKKGKEFLPLSM